MPPEAGRTRTLAIPRPGTPPMPAVPRPERFTLENGLRVAIVRRPDLPQVSARLVVRAGSVADPAATPGAASLVGSLLTEGTQRFSALELNGRIDSLGAALGARVGHDFAEIDLGLLAETLPEGLELLAEVIARPTFPERELERVRAEVLDALEARLDEPANVADDSTAEAVFGKEHPYGRLPVGTAAGVRALRREDLVAYHAAKYTPSASVLVIAGDIDQTGIRARLEATLGSWEGPAVIHTDAPAIDRAAAAGNFLSVAWEDAAQSEIRFAGVGLPRSSPRWIQGSVANYILGGSTITGRLGANLREDKGWTYGIRSSFAGGLQAAGWIVETAVGAEATNDAMNEILAELHRLGEDPVSEEELARAREAMILSLPRAFETPARIVSRMATLEAFGLPEDYWETFPARVAAVSAEEVLEIARNCFAPEELVRVAVGPVVEARSFEQP